MRKSSRSVRVLAVGASALMVLAACGSSGGGTGNETSTGSQTGESAGSSAPAASDEKVTLTFASYGGTFTDGQTTAWQQPYTALHPNVTFANTSPSDTAMIKAQVDAGSVQWDLADVDPFFASQYCDKYVQPLNLPDVDKADFDPALIGKCYFGAYRFALIISYNTKKWPDPATAPKTVADFFDMQKFPGQRGVVSDPTNGMLEYALLADGVTSDKLYPMDVDRALKKWDTIRSNTTFAANNGAMLQLATGGQVDMMMLVSARTKAAIDAKAPFAPIWDQTAVTFHTLVVPKGSPHADAAMKFIEFALQPEQSAAFAEAAGVSPTNNKSTVTLDENATKVNTFDPKVNTGGTFTVDPTWWGPNLTKVQDQFHTWLNG